MAGVIGNVGGKLLVLAGLTQSWVVVGGSKTSKYQIQSI